MFHSIKEILVDTTEFWNIVPTAQPPLPPPYNVCIFVYAKATS